MQVHENQQDQAVSLSEEYQRVLSFLHNINTNPPPPQRNQVYHISLSHTRHKRPAIQKRQLVLGL